MFLIWQNYFRYNEENSIVQTVATKNRWYTTYPRKQPFCIRDCTNQAEQPLRLGCELTLRNCLTILSCSYAKICDFIVAQEMPDSLTTMFKNRANVLILAIVANKMAFSLTTTQLWCRRNLKTRHCTNNDDRRDSTVRRKWHLTLLTTAYEERQRRHSNAHNLHSGITHTMYG